MDLRKLGGIVSLSFLAAGSIFLPRDSIASGEAQDFDGSVQLIDRESCNDMKRRNVLSRVFSSCERLRLVRFSYINFQGETKNDGSVVVLDAAAHQVLMVFDDLRRAHFPIEKANLMNAYNGIDDLSMNDNNTSSFNDRTIAGSKRISMHAYGAAIDINPKINPFVVHTGKRDIVKPASGSGYVDRSAQSPGMAEPVREIFANHGFIIWGGDWRNPIDYQHFQLSRDLAERLIALPADKAREYFENYVLAYRKCMAEAGERHGAAATRCGGRAVN
jgi:hypothetical protein